MLNLTENKIDNSKIKCFKQCPRMFFYEHVLGWRPESPSNHLVFGSAWHEAMEHLLLNGYDQKNILEAYDKFLTYYRNIFGPETDGMFKGKTPDKAFEALAMYTNYEPYRRDLTDFKTVYTEIAGSIAIDEKHSLFFRMDAVLENRKTGRIRSREHKTGSGSYLWAEQWLLDGQVGTYSHVLNCLYPPDKIDGIEMNGVFFPKRVSTCIPEQIFERFLIKRTSSQMQQWLDNTRFYVNEIDQEYELLSLAKESDSVLQAFPLRDTSCLNYFRLCPYHDFCLAWANPLQHSFDSPLGFKIDFWDPTEKAATETFNLKTNKED